MECLGAAVMQGLSKKLDKKAAKSAFFYRSQLRMRITIIGKKIFIVTLVIIG